MSLFSNFIFGIKQIKHGESKNHGQFISVRRSPVQPGNATAVNHGPQSILVVGPYRTKNKRPSCQNGENKA